MVLYLSIQLRCCNKNKTKMFIKRPTHKKWYLFGIILKDIAFSVIIRKLINKMWHNMQ